MNYKIKNSASFTQSLILSFSPLNAIAQLIVYLGIELVMNHINLLQQEEFVVLVAEVLYDIYLEVIYFWLYFKIFTNRKTHSISCISH